MRIQCGRAQTGFDPIQCALGAQCGRALTLLLTHVHLALLLFSQPMIQLLLIHLELLHHAPLLTLTRL